MINIRHLFLVIVIATSLTGCGSSGDGTSEAPQELTETTSGMQIVVDTEDGINVSTIAGEKSKHMILRVKSDSSIQSTLLINNDVTGIYFEETDDINFLVVDGTVIPPDSTIPITITAVNIDNNESASFEVMVNVLRQDLVASGTLTSGTGILGNFLELEGIQ